MVLVAPGFDAKGVFFFALVGHGEYLFALLIAHELGEFLDVALGLINSPHKGGIHDIGRRLLLNKGIQHFRDSASQKTRLDVEELELSHRLPEASLLDRDVGASASISPNLLTIHLYLCLLSGEDDVERVAVE